MRELIHRCWLVKWMFFLQSPRFHRLPSFGVLVFWWLRELNRLTAGPTGRDVEAREQRGVGPARGQQPAEGLAHLS